MRAAGLLVAVLVAGCDPEPVEQQEVEPTQDTPAELQAEAEAEAEPEPEPEPEPELEDEDDGELYVPEPAPKQALGKPIEFLKNKGARMIYAEPDYGAPFRGRLSRGRVFAVYERIEGGDPECKRGWGRVGVAAYACLGKTEATKRSPIELPTLARGQVTPFHYARRRKKGDPPPRWRHIGTLRRGDPPEDTLELEHDYAFIHRRRTSKGTVLTDRNFRVVREADVRRMKPSRFQGRDLTKDPVDETKTLAWVVDWPGAKLLAEPDEDAKKVGHVKFQTTLYIEPGEPTKRRRNKYWKVAGETEAWVNGKEIRRWNRMARPAGVSDAETWLDIELNQHTLTIYEGDTPQYVTVVASGSHKNPTPTGIFRLQVKQAYGNMRSLPTETDDPYFVEAVPWVMYFRGRYALHGTFWHNRFGYRLSHGCVNLAPLDAAKVYAATSPDPLPGWSSAYEHVDELGTTIRIRRGEVEPEDKRRKPRERRADRN